VKGNMAIDEKILDESEELLKAMKKVQMFSSKYRGIPVNELVRVINGMRCLEDSLPNITTPKNADEATTNELKRRLHGEAAHLDHWVSGEPYDFETVVDIYRIPKEDLEELRPWLLENKEPTQKSIERLFGKSDVQSFELPLAADIPSVRRAAEEVARTKIQHYHRVIGRYIQRLSQIGYCQLFVISVFCPIFYEIK